MLLDLKCNRIRRMTSSADVAIQIGQGLREFLDEQSARELEIHPSKVR